ncbi:hypothetical protein AB833_27560 [Chromatiales bacterium (ex Bugula neritina AB1)]|nr:hypothetical protein AB833_27560 [Chromatiales bacterium (ex Bugula neritina AB1)]
MSITAYLELERDELLDSVLLAMADSDAGRKPRPLRSKLPEMTSNSPLQTRNRPGKILSRSFAESPATTHLAPAAPSITPSVLQAVKTPLEASLANQTIDVPRLQRTTDIPLPVRPRQHTARRQTAASDFRTSNQEMEIDQNPGSASIESRTIGRRMSSKPPRPETNWLTVIINSFIVFSCAYFIWTLMR